MSRFSGVIAQIDRNGVLALTDQAVVSGVSLVASVIVGRQCGADGLGIYSLAMTIYVLLTSLHTALISTPYTVFYSRIEKSESQYFAGSSLIGSLIVMGIAVCLLAIAFPVFYFLEIVPSFEAAVLTLGVTVPFILARDFARRFTLAHFQIGMTVLIDLAVAVIQVAGLFLLAQLELLTPITAIFCMAIACGISAGAWLFTNRRKFELHRGFARKSLTRKWTFGRWVMLEHVLGICSAYVTPWLLIFFIDETATGIFAACMVVVNLSSPFLQGMGNLLSPKFAAAANNKSRAQLIPLYLRATFFMLTIMIGFVALCLVGGESFLQFLYPDDEYHGFGLVVVILSLRALAGTTNITTHHAFLAIERPLPNFFCSAVGLVATVVLGFWLIPLHGIVGGAYSMLFGTVLEVVVIVIWFTLEIRRKQITAV